MLTKENFTAEHIRELQQNSKCDPSILERTLFAFGLLEALILVDMPFIFKGGTSLMLLLEHPRRLSTDIDILVEPDTDLDSYLDAAAQIFPFVRQEEQPRAKHSGIEKRHFKFSYPSPMTGKEFYILLDVVFEANPYPSLVSRAIDNDLLHTEGEPLTVQLPSINCVLGDKLTAFAPHTTGIPLGIGKNMEIIKQFYDVATLLDEFTNFDEVTAAYHQVVREEIAYRGGDITPEEALRDTLNTALCIASRGKMQPDEYRLYVKAIRDLRDHIYAERYTPEVAARQAPRVIYAAACLLKNAPYQSISTPADYLREQYIGQSFMPLKYLKRIDPLAYALTIEADKILHG